jgi:7-cyano-7-deazaguanine synthase
MAEAPRALVLLSGGLDSAVALYAVLARGRSVLPVSFDYHLRPQREVRAVEALLANAAHRFPGQVAALQRIALPFLREASDLPFLPPHLEGAPEGYVPVRNLVFYAIAGSLAEAHGARTIVGGHTGEDPGTFPDAGPRFFGALNALFRDAAWSHAQRPFEVELPLAGQRKEDVLRMARDLGVPLGATWSCYADGAAPCGGCGSCQERREAFAALRVADPAVA